MKGVIPRETLNIYLSKAISFALMLKATETEATIFTQLIKKGGGSQHLFKSREKGKKKDSFVLQVV